MRPKRPCSKPLLHSTATAAEVKIPPESPQFIDIPKPKQPQQVPIIWNKGILPRPREVHQTKEHKSSPAFLARSAPARAPANQRFKGGSAEQREAWEKRQRAASLRRQNLRQGFTELKRRHDRAQARATALGEEKSADRQRRLYAPDTDDVRFTASTVLALANEDAAAHKKAALEQRRARYQRRVDAKQEERRVALHELYVNAQTFIVDEAGLEKKIAEAFEASDDAENEESSVWDEQGVPETVRWMLEQKRFTADKVADDRASPVEVSKERLQRMAEELTGGRI